MYKRHSFKEGDRVRCIYSTNDDPLIEEKFYTVLKDVPSKSGVIVHNIVQVLDYRHFELVDINPDDLIGKTALCVEGGCNLSEGRLYYIVSAEQSHYNGRWLVSIDSEDGSPPHQWYLSRFEILNDDDDDRSSYSNNSKQKEAKEDMETVVDKNTWSFSIQHEEFLDGERVLKVLSYKNPLAFITLTDAEGNTKEFAMIHHSLYKKMCRSKDMGEARNYLLRSVKKTAYVRGALLHLPSIKERKEVLAVVKDIKKATLKNKFRNPQNVTCLIPNVE